MRVLGTNAAINGHGQLECLNLLKKKTKRSSKQSDSTFNNLNLGNFRHQLLTFKEVLLFSGADGEAKECKLG